MLVRANARLFHSTAKRTIDLIELGLPFTDPIADGPTIQMSNTQALRNGITVASTLETVRKARRRGLKAPVLFMGYYNPLLSYGEEKILHDAREAGVNGFIVVDLPPEEAVRFRNFCTEGGYTYEFTIKSSSAELLTWRLIDFPTYHSLLQQPRKTA